MKRAGAIVIGKSNTPEFGAWSRHLHAYLRRDAQPLRLNQDLRWIFRRRRGLPWPAGSRPSRADRIPAVHCVILLGFRNACLVLPALHRPGAEPEGGVRLVHAKHIGMPGAFSGGPRFRSQHDCRTGFPGATLHQRTGRAFRTAPRPQFRRGARSPGLKDLGGVPFDARVRNVVDRQRATFESLGCIVEQASRTSLQPSPHFACSAPGFQRVSMAHN